MNAAAFQYGSDWHSASKFSSAEQFSSSYIPGLPAARRYGNPSRLL
jgi:hypothetical protein